MPGAELDLQLALTPLPGKVWEAPAAIFAEPAALDPLTALLAKLEGRDHLLASPIDFAPELTAIDRFTPRLVGIAARLLASPGEFVPEL